MDQDGVHKIKAAATAQKAPLADQGNLEIWPVLSRHSAVNQKTALHRPWTSLNENSCYFRKAADEQMFQIKMDIGRSPVCRQDMHVSFI